MKSSSSKQLFITIGILIAGYLFYKHIYDGTEYIRSTIDNNTYKVRKGSDQQLKADILAVLNGKFKIIINNLKNDANHFSNEAVQRLISNWENGVTIKEIGNMEKDAAYVINKKNMSFCLQKTSNQVILEELNLITYVAIHELAHIMSSEIGHGSEFIDNFEFLLSYAKNIVYYDPLLKRQLPLYIQLNKLNTSDSYCGVNLENSVK
jgi:predicted metal-dependent hydrolase